MPRRSRQAHSYTKLSPFISPQSRPRPFPDLNASFRETLEGAENFGKLVEVERDLVGVGSLVQPHRRFVREGALSRLSHKGPVQRLFLLFNDCLLYANRLQQLFPSREELVIQLFRATGRGRPCEAPADNSPSSCTGRSP